MADAPQHAYPPTDRTRVRRIPGRGVYDRAAIHAILDEALICHVGFVDGGRPFVIPTIHARVDETLYLHGSQGSRLLGVVAAGEPVCVTATLVDGLVLARSALHHSMNYRSVVVLGSGREVTDSTEKAVAFEAVVEHVVRGRSRDARMPSAQEAAATKVVALPIVEASAKVRTGDPSDEAADYALPIWAGVIPLALTPGAPTPDPKLAPGIDAPAYAVDYRRPGAAGM